MQIQEPGLLTPRRQTPLKQILKSPNTPSTSETRALAPDGPVTPTNVSPGDMTTESASSSEQSKFALAQTSDDNPYQFMQTILFGIIDVT